MNKTLFACLAVLMGIGCASVGDGYTNEDFAQDKGAGLNCAEINKFEELDVIEAVRTEIGNDVMYTALAPAPLRIGYTSMCLTAGCTEIGPVTGQSMIKLGIFEGNRQCPVQQYDGEPTVSVLIRAANHLPQSVIDTFMTGALYAGRNKFDNIKADGGVNATVLNQEALLNLCEAGSDDHPQIEYAQCQGLFDDTDFTYYLYTGQMRVMGGLNAETLPNIWAFELGDTYAHNAISETGVDGYIARVQDLDQISILGMRVALKVAADSPVAVDELPLSSFEQSDAVAQSFPAGQVGQFWNDDALQINTF